jgi:LPXTG-motif cell wall-anchored protein
VIAHLGVLPALLSARLVGQSDPPDTSGSDPFVLIVGVVLVTAIAVYVVARRKRSGK